MHHALSMNIWNFQVKKTLIKDFFLQKKTDVIDVSILQMDEVAGYPTLYLLNRVFYFFTC